MPVVVTVWILMDLPPRVRASLQIVLGLDGHPAVWALGHLETPSCSQYLDTSLCQSELVPPRRWTSWSGSDFGLRYPPRQTPGLATPVEALFVSESRRSGHPVQYVRWCCWTGCAHAAETPPVVE